MSITTDDLDDTQKYISVKAWRGYCFGVDSQGNHRGSNTTWALYKRETGYSIKGKLEPRDKYLTRRAAFKLFVRAKLPELCKKVNIDPPSKVDPMSLEIIADRILQAMGLQVWEDIINNLFVLLEPKDIHNLGVTSVDTELDAEGLDKFLVEWLGKSVPLSTKRRKCKRANLKYSTSRKKKYKFKEALKIAQTLAT